ncbi:MAG TPA: NAD(P)H-binding protein [Marinagarivorans sp.]
MANSQIVFAGAGDLAARAMDYLAASSQNVTFTGVARSAKKFAHGQLLQGDLTQAATLEQLRALAPKAIVVTLVPNGQGADGYHRGYIEPLQALVSQAKAWPQPPLIIFASSTGVYHQTDGEIVDETSPTEPASYSGACLLQAEQLLADSGLPYCAVRFGGIYGPGRDFLIRQVQDGKGGGPDYTNRIHQDDAGRCLGFLVSSNLAGKPLPTCLLACDSEPAPSNTVRAFIAQQLGLNQNHLTPSPSGRGGNKRCSNARLLSLGFVLQYPSFRQGYGDMARLG